MKKILAEIIVCEIREVTKSVNSMLNTFYFLLKPQRFISAKNNEKKMNCKSLFSQNAKFF